MEKRSLIKDIPGGRHLFAKQSALEASIGRPLDQHGELFGDIITKGDVENGGITITPTSEADLLKIKGLKSLTYNPITKSMERGIFYDPNKPKEQQNNKKSVEKKLELQKVAEDLGLKIAFLNRMVFNNQQIAVHIISPDADQWENAEGVAAYAAKNDSYVVLTKNIEKLSNMSEAGLFGTAAHEVRHRFQDKNPESILSQDFLIEKNILKKDALAKITSLNRNIPSHDLKMELDAMVIEELIRNTCKNLSLNEIVNDVKMKELVSILTSNENTFMESYLNTPRT